MASSESRPLPPVPSEILIALDQTSQRDELDSFVLAGGVTSVEDILNELIPDGTIFCSFHITLRQLIVFLIRSTEAALANTPLISLLLRSQVQELRNETEIAKERLKQDQSPELLESIQENIGVSSAVLTMQRGQR